MVTKCDWDARPAMPNWREHWKRPLCEHCSQYLLGVLAGGDLSSLSREWDEIQDKSRIQSGKVLEN